jgi:hypothetical protein
MWFWTPASQAAALEAWHEVAAKQGKQFDSAETFLASFAD